MYQYYPNYMYPQQPQAQQQQAPRQEQSGFISVNGEQQARDWPIAPGNSLTFKDETAPYIYTKTSYSQFDIPVFEKYRLTKEEDPQAQSGSEELKQAVQRIENELNDIKDGYKLLKDELEEMKNWMRQPFMSKTEG